MSNKSEKFHFLNDGGEMGKLMREKNWSETPLGSPENWPQSLRTTLNIVLNSPFPMFLFWGETLKCFYNDAYRPVLGKNGKHPFILGLNAKEAWSESWEEIEPLLDVVINKDESVWRENLMIPIFRNGQMEDVYWTFSHSPVKDESGNVVGVLTLCTDTTETIKAANSLAESERRFRELADQSPIWIWITDPLVNVKYANKELLDFIGIDHYLDFTGQVWEKMVHPQDIDLVRSSFGQAFQNQSDFSFEFRVRNALTEGYEWFKILGKPKFEDGVLTGFIGTGMNIEQQKSFSEYLKNEVDIRTVALANSNNKLEEMNKELQSFAYISSHDLQEPLRKIQMFAEVLMDREYDNLSKSGKVKFEKIQSAANRMQSLINDLLAYSRADTEKRVFELIDLENVINEVKNDIGEELEKKHGKVEVLSTCKLEVVPFQFRQLIYNLLSNSVKYSRSDVPPVIKIVGKIIDGSESDNQPLIVGTSYAKITITDNGIGFDKQFSEKIFEVFQRLHGKQEYAGTGVGLAIVKKIVQNHNGFIRAMGELGSGAVFEVIIPISQKITT